MGEGALLEVPPPQAVAPPIVAAPAGTDGPAASPVIRAYFARLHDEAMLIYDIANTARGKGKDPSLKVEIPPAEDLAARVEAQVGPAGVAKQIREATARLGNREVVSLQVAQDVADEMSRGGADRGKALDQAVRTGLSILTEGVLVAPLEGIAEVKIGHNRDGSDYVDLYFAGPIRAAGGTAQAMSVLIADLVRRRLGIGRFVATDAEVERYKEEIPAYKQAQHLQYNPTGEEIALIARNCPVCINGEGTEREEVAGNRDLERVETNQLRGGACLVMAEGMILKAPKVMKHVEKLGLEGWDFLRRFAKKSEEASKGDVDPIAPNNKFIQEIIAGRPVFGYPSRPGGFRLRYGRARTGGLAACAFHPASMAVVDDFLAVGTQLKVERPGKGTVATPCDTIEGPTVLLRNGSLVRFDSVAEVREFRPAITQIVDLGEILVPFGEFAENNAVLPPASWCVEWWEQVQEKTGSMPTGRLSGEAMVQLAETSGAPLHPDGTLLWHDVSALEIRSLGEFVLKNGWSDGSALWLPADVEGKGVLLRLLVLHRVEDGRVKIDERLAFPLLRGLGLDLAPADDGGGRAVIETPRRRMLYDPCQPDFTTRYPTVELAARLSGFALMPRAPCRVGSRMGRPEKADTRMMKPPPHALFPLAGAGGLQRQVLEASGGKAIEVEVGRRRCAACGRINWRTFCDCGGHTEPDGPPAARGQMEPTRIDVKAEIDRARAALKLDRLPEAIKGVQGLVSLTKVPEPLEKGMLRARHGLWVFKDGTVRYDMTDVPLTHFRPREVGASVERLRALGYTHDMAGAPLERDDQLLELRVQDLIVAESCGDYFVRAAKFLDDLLVRFYGLPAFYNVEHRRDLIGHLAIGLAPHTSGGVLARIIGYTKAQCHFGHPYYHAAKRRNCDGDEDAVMLLLDGLLNFSRAYIPTTRGGLMDLPLLLSTRLDPNEVDKETHNLDTLSRYPLSFFEASTRHAPAKEVAKTMRLVESRIGKPEQYEGLGFTHDTRDISEGPAASAYKTLGSMMDKMTAQMELARKIRAVDEADVGARVIGTHLLPDLMGNLKAFSKQAIRCPKCNAKFRRMPLKGACLECGNKALTLTVHEGSVRKYLEVSKQIAIKYKIDPYTQQRILLLERHVESLFQNDKVKKPKLADFG
jgi:DNA polymerase II large subunit